MTSGQWDLNALEALEREALEVVGVLEVPEHVRRCHQPASPDQHIMQHPHQLHQHHSHAFHPPAKHQPHHQQAMYQQQQQQHQATLPRHFHRATGPMASLHAVVDGTPTGGSGPTVGCLGRSVAHTEDGMQIELKDHIKHCSCTCNHMGYGNFMDYQTSCFGGLPDVTEHSHSVATQPHKIRHQSEHGESALITTQQNPLIGCLPTTPQKVPLTSTADQDLLACRQPLSALLEHQTHLMGSDTKLAAIGAAKAGHHHRRRSSILGRRCAYGFYGALLAGCLLGSVAFLVSYLGLADNFANHESYDSRVLVVKRLMRDSPLIDGHNDLPWNIRMYAHNRLDYLNFSNGLDKIEPWSGSLRSQTDWPRMKHGMVGAQFWSAYVPCAAQGLNAVQLALEQIDLIQRFSDWHRSHMRLVASADEIVSVHRMGLMASLIGVEGGHALGSSLSVLRSLYTLGARYLTLTHKCDSHWAGSSDSPAKGLTAFGRIVIKEMNRLGMMIDLSHASDATARDVLRETRAPVVFSHSAARALCNSTQNIPDDVLREVADNGGIVMVSFYSMHVSCSHKATIRDVIAHVNYIRTIAGVQHIGIGAGFDGIDSPPDGLENAAMYPNLFAELLVDPNWTEEDVQLLAGKNLLRVFRSVENVRDFWKRAAVLPSETLSPPPRHSPCSYMPS